MTISPDDLKEFRLKVPAVARHTSGEVCLEKMPGVTYRYDVDSQSIHLKVSDEARIPLDFDMHRKRPDPAGGQELSAVVNYSVFATAGTQDYATNAVPQYQGASVNMDGRIFSQYGVFSQSFTANSTATELTPAFLRLDTRWLYEDPDTLVTYTAGDVISRSLNWTTSIRMGGVQIQRDFLLRPDLVTMPLPQFSGSAAVPSTVEVMNDQARLFSQQITGGPFNINNIPLATGPGTMRIVLRDATGKETVSEYAYYNSTNLLAPGLFDYSAETGFARHFYGLYSDAYDGNPIGSGSFRYGVTPRLTVEGHAEGGAGLANLGGGVNFGLWHYGVASLAVSGSEWNGALGGQSYGSFETSLWGARLMLRTLRGFGEYENLASVTAPKCPSVLTGCTEGSYTYKKRDQVSLSIPLTFFDEGSINFSYADSLDYGGDASKLGTLSYGRRFIWDNSNISLNVFNDFETKNNYGAYASITYTWGKYSASSIAESSGATYAAGGSFSRSLGQEAGSYGYSVTALEGPQPYNSTSGSYRTSAFQASAGVTETGKSVQVTAQANGAIAFLNGVHFANRIDNSFAVVDTGIPNARVLYENNPIGETDSSGTLLIPNMRARDNNLISIDPASLPVQADMPETKQTVVPKSRGGMTVRFKGEVSPPSAMVSFKDGKGEWLPVGSEVWVNGGGTAFAVGYDGETYLTGLAAKNAILIKKPDGTPCNASFEFTPNPQAQVRIPDVVCAPAETAQVVAQAGGETVVAKR
jgi:outer membrane usher protein